MKIIKKKQEENKKFIEESLIPKPKRKYRIVNLLPDFVCKCGKAMKDSVASKHYHKITTGCTFNNKYNVKK